MTPLETAEQVFEVAFGYMASKALFAAAHLRIFDELAEGTKSLEELAKATGAEERALSTLLTALVSVGLLEPVGEAGRGFRNAPASQVMLVSSPKGSFADYCRNQIDRQMYPFLHNIADVLRGRRDTVPFEDYEAWFGDVAEASLYSESQHEASLPAAAFLASVTDLSGCRHLLDVGGGSGAFSITLCRRYPELSATVLDFPNVVEVGRRFVAEAGLEDRIDFVAGNALEVDWPGGQDAVLFSYVSGSVAAEGVRELYRHAHQALCPGGIVLVHDFMVDDDLRGPRLPALWAFQHAAFTPGGIALTPAFVTECLRENGFEEVSVSPFIPGMTRLARGRRRG